MALARSLSSSRVIGIDDIVLKRSMLVDRKVERKVRVPNILMIISGSRARFVAQQLCPVFCLGNRFQSWNVHDGG
jgi:hypothetical protein